MHGVTFQSASSSSLTGHPALPGGLSSCLHFFYDASNKPAIVDFNGTKYAYVHNLQGDVVAILDSTGTVVVQYKYDAWGKQIGKTGSMASTLGTVQPFRYRGYVYDEETGLNYLRSRYYNSAYARFLNADEYLWDKNIYAYCQNNAVNRADNDGNASASCIGDVTEDPVGGYHIDLSMAGNSSLWHSPLLNGEWFGYYVQTPVTYSFDHWTPPGTHASQKYDPNQIKRGWRVGQNIFNLTSKGTDPSWSTIRARWWKNEAFYSYDYYFSEYGQAGIDNMRKGLAPIGSDGAPLELHHPDGRDGSKYYVFDPVLRNWHIEHHRHD